MKYLILFFNIFAIYLYTLFPTIAAYRDAGEFATVAYILGVAHPPGYPLYSMLTYLLGRLLYFANFAYRINLLSAIFSALTAIVLFRIYESLIYRTVKSDGDKQNIFISLIGYIITLIFSLGYLQWYLSLVSEMYTLNTLFAMSLIFLSTLYYFFDKRFIYLLFFILGLGITNRIDLILFSPIVLFIGLDYLKSNGKKFLNLCILVILVTLGIISYLYLPIRSSCEPFIDWNNPAELDRFIASITRKTHGSTLDLISAGYNPGENFFDGIKLYISYLIKNLSVVGLIFVLCGLLASFWFNINYSLSLLMSWLLSCVYFVYKANMPPNPHAMAILEAHFLLPNVIIYIWFIFGISSVIERHKSKVIKYILVIFLFSIAVNNFIANIRMLNKRNNFYAYDYTVNLFRSVPDRSLVVVKEDVQLFSCFYRKFVDGFRSSVFVIASGLSGSTWYQQMYKNYLSYLKFVDEIFLTRLDTEDAIEKFVSNNIKNFRIYITPDVELVRSKSVFLIPQGFGTELSLHSKKTMPLQVRFFYDNIYVFRGRYRYDLNWEFFSSDIIEDYSKGLLNYAHEFVGSVELFEDIKKIYKKSIFMNPILPYGYFDIAYMNFIRSMYNEALYWYNLAIHKFKNFLLMAKKYKAASDVIQDISQRLAICYLHLGVVQEKLNMLDSAVDSYSEALKYNPYLADAYYNLAVVYWRKNEWGKVRYYLSQVLRINPEHKEARYYIERIPK
ncbi:MAG: DUF2723 domain-containing protein [Endomicrobia bacterium]|nr:DUF2723 domain-containing protein [Endomicrobiia bacterium]